MKAQLRILILEDQLTDAELMAYELRQAKISHIIKRVDTEGAFVRELEEYRPDLILSDYHLPSFNGLAALGLAQARSPEVPFIFVSGAMGEEVAIESLKRGATDYVLKDHLARLGPAVTRALRETGRTPGTAAGRAGPEGERAEIPAAGQEHPGRGLPGL
jgi:DNA-binding NtrC family response regulator